MYTFDFICHILEVRPISFENLNQNINELVFDSRKINQPDQSLFFAIHGARDGHDFLPSAYNEGIRSFVISKPVPFFNDKTDVNLLFVDDT
ncbi:MAG: bifunctional UDP-N-acetylmuramoyl-tripeptide:D-alanyl-D-alanine ligase/alanine racemase, partial [Sphingobacterium sp.]